MGRDEKVRHQHSTEVVTLRTQIAPAKLDDSEFGWIKYEARNSLLILVKSAQLKAVGQYRQRWTLVSEALLGHQNTIRWKVPYENLANLTSVCNFSKRMWDFLQRQRGCTLRNHMQKRDVLLRTRTLRVRKFLRQS